MKYRFCLNILFVLLLGTCSAEEAKRIKVLFTSAIIKEGYKKRKADYIRNLKLLKKYGCDVYVVESCQKGPTFLDKYCDNVCYTKSNDTSETKSFNEVKSMLIGVEYFNFQPDDMILKVTGRYVLEDDRFISFVKGNMDADIIARIWNQVDAYTGYFAIKQKYFFELLDHYYHIYHTKSKKYAIEHALGNFINSEKKRLNVVPIPLLYDYTSVPERRQLDHDFF